MYSNFHNNQAIKETVKDLRFIKSDEKHYLRLINKSEKEQIEFFKELFDLLIKGTLWGLKRGVNNITIPFLVSFKRRVHAEMRHQVYMEGMYDTQEEIEDKIIERRFKDRIEAFKQKEQQS